jgi:hypothetical protein
MIKALNYAIVSIWNHVLFLCLLCSPSNYFSPHHEIVLAAREPLGEIRGAFEGSLHGSTLVAISELTLDRGRNRHCTITLAAGNSKANLSIDHIVNKREQSAVSCLCMVTLNVHYKVFRQEKKHSDCMMQMLTNSRNGTEPCFHESEHL